MGRTRLRGIAIAQRAVRALFLRELDGAVEGLPVGGIVLVADRLAELDCAEHAQPSRPAISWKVGLATGETVHLAPLHVQRTVGLAAFIRGFYQRGQGFLRV